MHLSCPDHPLIYATILATGRLPVSRQIIVENDEKAERLLHNLKAFPATDISSACYRVIRKPRDVLEWLDDSSLIGIFTPATIDLTLDTDALAHLGLTITRSAHMSADTIIHWITDHGYEARKGDTPGYYLLQGDTLTIHTKK